MAKKRSRAGLSKQTQRTRAASKRTAETRARSVAAKKGWQTRKRAAAKRSRAARKGWETRRAHVPAAATRGKRGSKVSGKQTAKQKTRAAAAPRAEFAVSADYRSRKAGSAVTVQIAAIGPANATREDAERATFYKIDKGRSPRGWQIRIVDWRGEDYSGGPVKADKKIADAWHTLRAPLSLADLSVYALGDS